MNAGTVTSAEIAGEACDIRLEQMIGRDGKQLMVLRSTTHGKHGWELTAQLRVISNGKSTGYHIISAIHSWGPSNPATQLSAASIAAAIASTCTKPSSSGDVSTEIWRSALSILEVMDAPGQPG